MAIVLENPNTKEIKVLDEHQERDSIFYLTFNGWKIIKGLD